VKNVIPPSRLTQAVSIMLNKYTPQPNTMDMGSMTMMGQPTAVGAGNDANNYLDERKRRMYNDQGTARVDHKIWYFSATQRHMRMASCRKVCRALATITTISRKTAFWPRTTSSRRIWSTWHREPFRA
jgi:hypothetical protein